MDFGIHFFPTESPDTKSAEDYFRDSLDLVGHCDDFGLSHVRIVEHYFTPYGGYSPNPLTFLAAASQRTQKARLITGAVLPAFNHPLKLAGEIAMVDGISGGRLEVGFGRAFLPLEFDAFAVDLNESRERFDEGIEQVRLLLEQENVTSKGQFHSFEGITSLPRPTQTPRPPFWVAAVSSVDSVVAAAKAGHHIMGVPLAADKLKELIEAYREAWKEAGHPGNGKLMLMFQTFCWPNDSEAKDIVRGPVKRYLASLVEAASAWTTGRSSSNYPGYEKIIESLKKETFDTTFDKGAAWVGTPETIIELINDFQSNVGVFDIGSLQATFSTLPHEQAMKSVRLFSEKVMPAFQ